MELRHLRYFLAVAEESTLVAAAKRLRIAQPALTRQIHDLEREVGVELFERGAKGVALTPAGDACLVSARHILHQVDVAVQRARGTSTGIVGRCVICVGPRALASGLIARVVARVHAEYPAIEVVVTEGSAERQWDAIRLRDADIGLGVSAPRDYHELSSDAVAFDIFDAVLLSSAHVLAQRPALALADLRSETFLFWTARFFGEVLTRQKAEFARREFKPARTRDFSDVYSLSLAVAAGQGWTLLPGGATAFAIEGTTIVPLEDFKLPVPLALITRLDEQRPVIRTVLGVMRRIITEERAATSRGSQISPDPVVIPVAEAEPARVVAMELRHLRYFSAVVEATSFGRAAERLELTQPALSRQVRDLERAVGVDLLERAARGATVTPAGATVCAARSNR